VLKPEIEIEVRDKSGRLVRHEIIQGKCFTRNFVNILRGSFGNIFIVLTDTGGTQDTYRITYIDELFSGCVTSRARMFNARAGEGVTDYGIVVGTGTTSPTVDDYKLESQIPHGDGDNQLHYDAVAVEDVVVDTSVSPPIISVTIKRNFTNNGSVDINVNEIGLIVKQGARAALKYCLVIRDVITTQTVSPGQSILIKFKIKVQGKFVKNFIDFLHHGFNESNDNVIDTSGNSKAVMVNSDYHESDAHRDTYRPLGVDAPQDDHSFGIQVGSSDIAYSYDQYSLQSRYPNSELKHYDCQVLDIIEETDRFKIPIRRAFENVTDTTKSIREVGLVALNHRVVGGITVRSDVKFMILRDVLPTPIDLNPGDIVTITVYIVVPK